MRKIRNLVLGGIQQKMFNLVLAVILLMVAAYTVVTISNMMVRHFTGMALASTSTLRVDF